MATAKKQTNRKGGGGKPLNPELITRFGKNVRGRREGLSLTQDELAARLECTRVNVSNIEGGRQGVSLVMFVALCGALECSPDAMLAGVC